MLCDRCTPAFVVAEARLCGEGVAGFRMVRLCSGPMSSELETSVAHHGDFSCSSYPVVVG